MHEITCKGKSYFHTIPVQEKIKCKLIHSYFEITPEIIIVHPELTLFFITTIYRNIFFKEYLIFFLGLLMIQNHLMQILS